MKDLLILLTVHVFRERSSVCVCASVSFEGGVWDLIILVPDHCLSFYLGAVSCLERCPFPIYEPSDQIAMDRIDDCLGASLPCSFVSSMALVESMHLMIITAPLWEKCT